MARSSHQTYLKHLLWNSPDVGRHGWVPAADVYELQHGWMIKVELAGIRPQNVSVTLDGDVLRVVGRRRDWVAHETRGCRSLEISYERFAQASTWRACPTVRGSPANIGTACCSSR